MNIRRYTERDSARLVDIWLAAVRATHHFLIEDDIQFFLPRLRDLHIPALEVHVAEDDNGRVLGFAGWTAPIWKCCSSIPNSMDAASAGCWSTTLWG